MEIERKWLFNLDNVPIEKSPSLTYYKQGYLSVEPEVRIRTKKICHNPVYCNTRIVEDSSETYMLCIKSNGDLSRIEVQKELSREEFDDLLKVGGFTEDEMICKQYYTIALAEGLLTVAEVDKGNSSGFCCGEIEFNSEEDANKFVPPDWFGEEVTYDEHYKMKHYWKKTRVIKYK